MRVSKRGTIIEFTLMMVLCDGNIVLQRRYYRPTLDTTTSSTLSRPRHRLTFDLLLLHSFPSI